MVSIGLLKKREDEFSARMPKPSPLVVPVIVTVP
jgi:hypothetical protein